MYMQLTNIGKEHVKAVLTQHQEFHKAQQVTQQLAALSSEVGMEEYEECLAQMRVLMDEWAKGGKVTLSSTLTSAVHTCEHMVITKCNDS